MTLNDIISFPGISHVQVYDIVSGAWFDVCTNPNIKIHGSIIDHNYTVTYKADISTHKKLFSQYGDDLLFSAHVDEGYVTDDFLAHSKCKCFLFTKEVAIVNNVKFTYDKAGVLMIIEDGDKKIIVQYDSPCASGWPSIIKPSTIVDRNKFIDNYQTLKLLYDIYANTIIPRSTYYCQYENFIVDFAQIFKSDRVGNILERGAMCIPIETYRTILRGVHISHYEYDKPTADVISLPLLFAAKRLNFEAVRLMMSDVLFIKVSLKNDK